MLGKELGHEVPNSQMQHSYLFSSKDRENINYDYFTKISKCKGYIMIILLKLVIETTFHQNGS